MSFIDQAFGLSDDLGFTLTPEENALFSRLFRNLDVDFKGTIPINVVIPFLVKSKLPQNTLRDIWNMVDEQKTGSLTQNGFYKILKLIALSQQNKTATIANLSQHANFPFFEGVEYPKLNRTFSINSPSAPANGAGTIVYALSNEEKERYKQAFLSCNPVNGLVNGDKAKEFFLKSNLPVESLIKIWNLADSNATGALNLQQFMVAFFFIMRTKTGSIQTIPNSVPPALWNSINGAEVSKSPLPGSNSLNLSVGEEQKQKLTASDSDYNIPPELKAQYDQHFDALDINKRGYLTGKEVADQSKSGNLKRDDFRTAMWLIRQQMTLQATAPSSTPTPPNSARMSYLPPTQPQNNVDLLDFSAPTSAILSPSPIQSTTPLTSSMNPSLSFSGISSLNQPLTNLQFNQVPAANLDPVEELKAKKLELKDVEKQFENFKPLTEEMKEKRSAMDSEFKSVMDQKHQLTLKLSQARAMYEAESQILADTQSIVGKEKQIYELAKQELQQIEQALEVLTTEKENTLAFVNKCRIEAEEASKKAIELREQGSLIRADLDKLRAEHVNVSKILDVKLNSLQIAQAEYQQLKSDLQQTQSQYDHDKSRINAISNQIAVQSVVTEKEKQKLRSSQNNLSQHRPTSSVNNLSNANTAPVSTTQAQINSITVKPPSSPSHNLASPSSSVTSPPKPSHSAKEEFDALFSSNKPRPSSSSVQSTDDFVMLKRPGSANSLVDTSKKPDSTRSAPLEKSTPITSTLPPPRPPSSTKPQHAPGAGGSDPSLNLTEPAKVLSYDIDSELLNAFSGAQVSGIPRTTSPSKEVDSSAFQKFGDTSFNFDTSFGTSPLKENNPFPQPTFTTATGFSAFPDFDSAFPAIPENNGSFDTAFSNPQEVDFNAAFGPALPTTASTFENSFASQPVQSLSPPPSSPEKTGENEDDLMPEVKEVMALGYSKDAALGALEKNGFDINAAVDELSK
ncbi:hypothetical protein HK099_006334 [Clydaea vesicula]|uniref:Uncharacterized protein n=1 Tax=Clydaea vesicula TaxID=447962 RepID=A0AAD5U805_9FUNG|nr:hypothetical protein HK099_006334 [Clydaea vesicula]